MNREPNCPVCDRAIPLPLPSFTDSFRCPHCCERVRVVQFGTSETARWIIDGAAVLVTVFFAYELGWRGEMIIGVLIVAGILLVNAVLMRLSGSKLEPAGRLGLGESVE